MPKNIKKRSASHIYYGVDKDTGALMHISQVPSGAKCNCKCALCGEPFEARKGTQRRHHFAHVSNYECMYAGEVAVYRGFASVLQKLEKIRLPAVTLQFPTWDSPELLQECKLIAIDQVLCNCTSLAYPPELCIAVGTSSLRIILDFDHYYDDADRAGLAEEAKLGRYSTLMYSMPNIDEDSFSPEQLIDIAQTEQRAHWVFGQLEARWRSRFYKDSKPLSGSYLCPISIGMDHKSLSTRHEYCTHCEYNIALPPKCLCTAGSGIRHKNDFYKDKNQRKAEIEKIRLNNEERIKHRAAASAAQESHTCQNSATAAELRQEYQRIVSTFDPTAKTWTVDKYDRRWIKCRICGEIKESSQFASYGGPDGANLGICAACNRKGLAAW